MNIHKWKSTLGSCTCPSLLGKMPSLETSGHDAIESLPSVATPSPSGCSSSVENSESEFAQHGTTTHYALQTQTTVSRRRRNLRIACWALVDASASVVSSAVMGLYPSFAQQTIFVDSAKGVESFVVADAVVALSVALFLVLLGGVVDVLCLKRYVAIISTAISGVSCMMLKLIKPTDKNDGEEGNSDIGPNTILMLFLYSIAVSSTQFIDAVAGAFLRDITMGRNVGFVSCIGSALGQLVGVFSLVLVSILSPNNDDVDNNYETRLNTAKSYGNIMVILGVILLLIGTIPSFFIHDIKPLRFNRKVALKGSFKEGWKKTISLGKYATRNGKILGLIGASMALLVLGIVGGEGRSSSVFLFVTESDNGQESIITLDDIELSAVISSIISVTCSFSIGFMSKHFSLFWLGICAYGIKIISLVLCACLGICTKKGKIATSAIFWICSVLKAMSNGPLFSIMRSIMSLNLPKSGNTSSTTFFLTYALICIAILIGCFISSMVLKAIESDRKEIYTAKFFSFPIITTILSFLIFFVVCLINKPKKKTTIKTKDEDNKSELCQTGTVQYAKYTESVIQVNQMEKDNIREEDELSITEK